MKIIVGLGNPGPQYELTRHNVGFLAIDRLVDRWKATVAQAKYHAELYQATFEGEKILLMKPQTFMNLSGRSVAAAMSFYQCAPEDLIVIHDDLDLDAQSIRLKTGGGTGGHNGLKSIDECLGKSKTGYHRIRIGIGHPQKPGPSASQDALKRSKMSPAHYVLEAFDDQQLKELDPVLDDVVEAASLILQGKIKIAMNHFHARTK
ncbi:MAG: aminoacyl-tRNA hydrolase [Bdellovibrionia bacterium]